MASTGDPAVSLCCIPCPTWPRPRRGTPPCSASGRTPTGPNYCVGFEAAGQQVGITYLFNRLNGTTGRLLRLRR
jgi:hypothetical protein